MARKQCRSRNAGMFAWLLCLLAVAGGGPAAVAGTDDPTLAEHADEYQEIMQDILRVLQTIQSRETARDARPELSRLQEKLADHKGRSAAIDKSDKAYQKLSDEQKKRVRNAGRAGLATWKEAERLMKDRAIFGQIGDLLLSIRKDGQKVPPFSNRTLAGKVKGQPWEFKRGRVTVNAGDGSHVFSLFSGQTGDVCDTSAQGGSPMVELRQGSIGTGLSAVDSSSLCTGGIGKVLIDAIDDNEVTGKLYVNCGDDNVVNGTFVATRCDRAGAPGAAAPARAEPDRVEVTSVGRDRYGDALPAGAITRLGTVRLRHPGMSRIIFSPDSKRVATISALAESGDVRIWDTETGQRLAPETGKLSDQQWHPGTMSFSHDGRRLRFVAGASLRTFELNAGTLQDESKMFPDSFRNAEYCTASQEGRYIACMYQGVLHVYDADKSKQTVAIRAVNPWTRSITISQDGSVVVTVDVVDGRAAVHVWSGSTGKQMWRHELSDSAAQPGLSPDGKLIAIPLNSDDFAIFALASGKEVMRKGARAKYFSFSRDGKRLATLSAWNDVNVWEVDSGNQAMTAEVPSSFTHGIWFSPDGNTLAVADRVSGLWLLDAASGTLRSPAEAHTVAVQSVAMSFDGNQVLSAGSGEILIWNADTQTALVPKAVTPKVLALSPDGKRFVAGWGQLSVYHSDSRDPVWALGSYQDSASIDFSPDGRLLAVPVLDSSRGSVSIVDVSDRSTVETNPIEGVFVSCAWFSDGKRFACGAADGTVRVWQTSNRREVAALTHARNDGRVLALAVHPNHEVIAAVLSKFLGPGRPRFWDVSTGKPWDAGRFEGIDDNDRKLAKLRFSPDGNIMAAVSAAHSLLLWDWKTGKLLADMRGPQEGILDFAFSGDGTKMVTAGMDTTLLIWDVARLLAQDKGQSGQGDQCSDGSPASQVPVMTSATGPGDAVKRSGAYGSDYEAWQAFDGSKDSMWISEVWQAPAWIAYEWGDGPRTITRYSITFVNGGSLTSRAPRDWTLQGWNGNSWVVVDTRTAQSDWAGAETRTYDVASPGSHSQYRLHVTEDNDSRAAVVVVSVGRLDLMGCR
jgi:WD40 repeat protein